MGDWYNRREYTVFDLLWASPDLSHHLHISRQTAVFGVRLSPFSWVKLGTLKVFISRSRGYTTTNIPQLLALSSSRRSRFGDAPCDFGTMHFTSFCSINLSYVLLAFIHSKRFIPTSADDLWPINGFDSWKFQMRRHPLTIQPYINLRRKSMLIGDLQTHSILKCHGRNFWFSSWYKSTSLNHNHKAI
jgi:hypothetical protein